MKAAQFQGKGNVSVVKTNTPVPREDEVLIQVKSCGICGTDQHIYHGQPGSAEVVPPRILGHEFAGVVVQVGEQVTIVKPGDRVSIDPNIYCGKCQYCRNGTPHLCDEMEAVGVTRDGGMAEFALVPEANCYHIPENMSFEEGALVEPLGCVLHGVKKLKLRANARVLIIGGGFIGQLFLQLVKRLGVEELVVSEPAKEKHNQLLALGATSIVHPLDPNQKDELINTYDVVIECVGRDATMTQAIQAAKKGGQVLLFGVSSPDVVILVSPFEIFAKELTIQGSFINPYTHLEAITLISQEAVNVESLITHRFSLDEVPEMMAKYPTLNVSKALITY